MLNFRERISYVDFFLNEVSSVFSLEENSSGYHHHTAIEYVLGCARPAAGGQWTCTLGSRFASKSHPAGGLWVVSSRGQLTTINFSQHLTSG